MQSSRKPLHQGTPQCQPITHPRATEPCHRDSRCGRRQTQPRSTERGPPLPHLRATSSLQVIWYLLTHRAAISPRISTSKTSKLTWSPVRSLSSTSQVSSVPVPSRTIRELLVWCPAREN